MLTPLTHGQTYLLGYEFPSTLMLLGKRKVYFVVSSSKGASRPAQTERFWEADKPTPRATAKLLQPLLTPPKSGEKVEVEILTRSKDEAENKKLFEQIIQLIGDGVRTLVCLPQVRTSEKADSSGRPRAQNKVGALPKDKMTGKFVIEWQNVLKESGADVKEVDVALGVSALLAVKDSEELVRIPLPVSRARCRGEAHPE